MAKKARKVKKEYSFCKSLVFGIQSITKEKTHEILATLVTEAEKACEEYEAPIDQLYYNEKRVKKYVYYPNTQLYLGVYVIITSKASNYWNTKQVPKNGNLVEYSFKLPQSYVKMSEAEFDDIAVDGMLMDESFDFNEPSVKNPKTPEQKREEERQKKELAKLEREKRLAAKQAKKIP